MPRLNIPASKVIPKTKGHWWNAQGTGSAHGICGVFQLFFDENNTRIFSKPILRGSNIPGKHSDVAQGYQGSPNYSSHKYSAWSNESMWENSKQVLEFTANYLNFQLESKRLFRVQECHFSSLRSPNFYHRWVTRVLKSIYFFQWRQWTSCFINILHFVWRGASQNVQAGKYKNLGKFFMLIFKNWTAPDDPTKTGDMVSFLARIIKGNFQDGWAGAYRETYILFTSLKFQ